MEGSIREAGHRSPDGSGRVPTPPNGLRSGGQALPSPARLHRSPISGEVRLGMGTSLGGQPPLASRPCSRPLRGPAILRSGYRAPSSTTWHARCTPLSDPRQAPRLVGGQGPAPRPLTDPPGSTNQETAPCSGPASPHPGMACRLTFHPTIGPGAQRSRPRDARGRPAPASASPEKREGHGQPEKVPKARGRAMATAGPRGWGEATAEA